MLDASLNLSNRNAIELAAPDGEFPIEFVTSQQSTDREWDAALLGAGGHHVQSSLWGQLKASLGWRAVRLMTRRRNQIIAGCQLLLRTYPILGTIAYIPKGPVFIQTDSRIAQELAVQLKRAVRSLGIRCLIVHPPGDGCVWASVLPRVGFRPVRLSTFPTATTVVDLTPDEETILLRMKQKTRYNIRVALRKHVTVRDGNIDDPALHRLLLATAQRKQAVDYSPSYLATMSDVLGPRHMKTFVAECSGEAICALLVVAFGDSVVVKKVGWLGERSELHPNECLHWHAIRWAKAQGYLGYDFDGINRAAAEAVLADKPLPSEQRNSTTRFKLGFGGRIVLLSDAYVYFDNRVLRLAQRLLSPTVVQRRWTARFLDRVKTRGIRQSEPIP